MRNFWVSIGAAAFGAASAAAPASAQECKPLTLLTSIDLVMSDDHQSLFVPVDIEGTKKVLLLDTGGVFSSLTEATADQLHLVSRQTSVAFYSVNGKYSDRAVHVNAFGLGRLSTGSTDFVLDDLGARELPGGGISAGILAPNLLRNYDVEIDIGASKFNILSTDHCEGKVIYWPASTVAVVPMRVSHAGHIFIPVTLDGHVEQAMVDTGATDSFIGSHVAEVDFGVKMGAPDTPAVGPMSANGPESVYEHKFHTLTFDGITISNPTLEVIPDLVRNKIGAQVTIGSRFSQSDEGSALGLTIGMRELRHLHLYIAFKEQKIYITPAQAP